MQQQQQKQIKPEFKTVDGSFALRWEMNPLHAAQVASTSGGDAQKGSAQTVAASISTGIPPGVKQHNQNGLYGATYAVPRLVMVELSKEYNGAPAALIVMNCYDTLYIMDKTQPNQHPVHTISFGSICPTCHACQLLDSASASPSQSDHDYAVGLSTGELISFSMRHHIATHLKGAQTGGHHAQMDGGSYGSPTAKQAAAKNSGVSKVKISGVQFYNRENAASTGRCTAVAWSPRKVATSSDSTEQQLNVLVAAFVDGSLHVYSPNCETLVNVSPLTPRSSPMKSPGGTGIKSSSSTPSLKVSTSSEGNNTSQSSSSFFSSLGRRGGQSQGDLKEYNQQSSNESSTKLIAKWVVSESSINEVAFSKDGYQLAAVSRDGVLRIFDAATGTLRAGCHSYFGGYLCVSWSPDGRYVLAGGEDDLVEIFSVADNAIVAFGDGHNSWVSGVTFLSVTNHFQTLNQNSFDANGSLEEASLSDGVQQAHAVDMDMEESTNAEFKTRVYKFVSVAQDTQLLCWEFEAPDEHDLPDAAVESSPSRPRHRRWISSGGTNSTPISIAIPSTPSTHPLQGGDENKNEQDASTAIAFDAQFKDTAKSVIAESLPRSQMVFIPPMVKHQVHTEQLSSVLHCPDGIVTLCHLAVVKFWEKRN